MQVLMTNSGQQAQVHCDDVYKDAQHKTVAVPSQRVVGPFFRHRCFRVEVLLRAVASDSSVHAVLA